MKIAGHPIHIMLIHFPSALFPLELMLSLLGLLIGIQEKQMLSFYLILGGVIFGWLSFITGILDLIKLSSEDFKYIKYVLFHGFLNGFVLAAYTIFAIILIIDYPQEIKNSYLILLLKVFLNIVLIAGNYIGGHLILKYKAGSMDTK